MATACIAQVTFGFEPKAKPVVAAFDLAHASSEGGAVLLKSLDTQPKQTKRLAGCLVDTRQPGKVQHQTLASERQRVFGLACGYADCNDAARLANTVIETQRRLEGRATRITIDVDPTHGPTHGPNESTFFDGHYDTWCCLPSVATVTFNNEGEQFAVAAVLRPGTAPATRGARGILRCLFGKLRAVFPTATLRVRLDGGAAHPKLFEFLEQQPIGYVENRSKDLHHGLEMDHASCGRFLANQFRVLLALSRRACCSRTCGAGRRTSPVRMRELRRCASGCSSSPCGSGARSGGPSRTSWQRSAYRGDPRALPSHQERTAIPEDPSATRIRRAVQPPDDAWGHWTPCRPVRLHAHAPPAPWGARRSDACTFMNVPG
jgi:hypothetical protein